MTFIYQRANIFVKC